MEQATFAELEHDSKKRRTRRELFLEKMEGLVPWERLDEGLFEVINAHLADEGHSLQRGLAKH